MLADDRPEFLGWKRVDAGWLCTCGMLLPTCPADTCITPLPPDTCPECKQSGFDFGQGKRRRGRPSKMERSKRAMKEAPKSIENRPTTMKWYWLSFCDPDRPTGSQFLGAAIVAASGEIEAVKVSHVLGCNPGGEVVMVEVPQCGEEANTVLKKWSDRLFTRDETDAFDIELKQAKANDDHQGT